MLKSPAPQFKSDLKPAFGMVTFLLGLLIVSIMFALMIPTLKSTSGGAFGPSSVKTESAEEKANEMVNDIQKMREESIQYKQQIIKEGN